MARWRPGTLSYQSRLSAERSPYEPTRTPPEYVRFVGESRVLEVVGEHSIDTGPEMTTLTNTFTVDGSVPGVEQYFKRNLDEEIENLADALQETIT